MSETEELIETYNPFSSPTTTSDVTLVVEDKKLHVCKAVLALMSPVFERMFYGEFKEKNSSEVQLPGKKHDEVLEFLRCIYPTTLQPLEKETVEAVMLLADEYEVERLLQDCVKFLIKESAYFNLSEKVHLLHLSEKIDALKKVYQHYVGAVAKSYRFKKKNEGTSDSEFMELSMETRYNVAVNRVRSLEK